MRLTDTVVLGEVDGKAVDQLTACALYTRAPVAAQMADGHLGYGLSIGGVLGLPDHVSPDGVGYDIGCGNKAVRTNLQAKDVPVRLVMDQIWREINFGANRGQEVIQHPILDEIAASELAPQAEMIDKARKQLGTVGGGNHYVDLFTDDEGWLWVGVHFGSRGFGHSTATEYIAHAKALSPPNDGYAPPIGILEAASEVGSSYLEAMRLAGAYAEAGRSVVVDRVLGILGGKSTWEVHNHHNYAWREEHEGYGALWVIRKGATPAFPGQTGFVGATMAEPSVILEGVDSDLSSKLLYSTVHGAGRLLSRGQAAGKVKHRRTCQACAWVQPPHTPKVEVCPACGDARIPKRPVRVSEGSVDWTRVRAEMDRNGIELRGAAADEAPEAYKRLREVLGYHAGTVRVLTRLYPLGVAMAGPDVPADD